MTFLDAAESCCSVENRKTANPNTRADLTLFSCFRSTTAGIEAKNAARTTRDFADFPDCTLYIPEVKWVEKRILV